MKDYWKIGKNELNQRVSLNQRQYMDILNVKNEAGKLVVEQPNEENITFDFPRSSKDKHLCLADYFGKNDVVAFQSVTVGGKVADIIEQWNQQDKYTDAYYLHGLAVEFAEAMAEWIKPKNKIRIKDWR